MQESIVFLVRVQCRRKESSRSLSHLLMSFLLHLCGTTCRGGNMAGQGSTCHLLKMLLHQLVLDQLQLMNQRIKTSLFVLHRRRRSDHRPDTLHDVIAAHVTPLHFRFRKLVAVSASGHAAVRVSVYFRIAVDDARLGIGSEIGR